MQRDPRAGGRVGVAGELEPGDEIDSLAGLRIDAGLDRSVGQQDSGRVVLEDRGESAYRRLVTGHDRDQPGHAGGVQVQIDALVDELAADERVAHALGAVELSIRDADRVHGRDQSHS